ncbi:hypothetical protein FRUB_04473 [Fimbriiglobus ruber]|uniref:Uncharacterized protein n=1 Tax=Fimbriiglobus ruber TaxID=1908690 RepID=A0A225E127_9BACT|nr:hypothetical protein FRUB_04473 [Fimbriiglobus ruber]
MVQQLFNHALGLNVTVGKVDAATRTDVALQDRKSFADVGD